MNWICPHINNNWHFRNIILCNGASDQVWCNGPNDQACCSFEDFDWINKRALFNRILLDIRTQSPLITTNPHLRNIRRNNQTIAHNQRKIYKRVKKRIRKAVNKFKFPFISFSKWFHRLFSPSEERWVEIRSECAAGNGQVTSFWPLQWKWK